MRHRKKKTTLDREASHRRALLKNLATSLVLHEKVNTTDAKAKALRPFVERLVTRAKIPTLANRRLILAQLLTQGAVKKMFEVIGPRYQARAGGYTRITKTVVRRGDAAQMAVIEFV
ncbi:50S ribosomal protein L17 [Candidatus Uhrbacteria bacterium RIFCSPHIGHO2_12_FULL_54_23]|uniref:Large ribosomal subunit protein bL17 n=3 Tax=Candidatus Uhriibacteriota TaxID=1752732 RepID=A0A1F7UMP1_9BACT|nr:MAG: 50S ribosomal protein L17 [Candidatus Uhrbacteria bacterium RIFCSPHIGHO2_12_FULL_54_23]OGL84537.1 MAG: 50S ribosomal protein L17 [Candidatus Uhrbacteria bacterium RIFCSPLOWO2_01_FULL_55_36]OGL90950.1 MAG: 50S ribosomal protein L17 [Candidatus Uhrbacteria bacterium RIFCSPLOWO2_02_FULL_54_37]